jgi:UDP:flavonoid glycosyltransferase YjiC (YdhE family)
MVPSRPPAMAERLRVLVSAGFSEGHAFPALALSRALSSRGHAVTVETSERWREAAADLGARFAAAPGYLASPAGAPVARRPEVGAHARALAEALRDLRADAVVADLATPAPALAAEAAGISSATLIPTLYPVQEAGLPLYPLGLVAPRTRLGAAAWRALEQPLGAVRPTTRWLRRVPDLLDAARAEIGLPPLPRRGRPVTTYGTISDRLALVATLPQLEYPRRWPGHVHVTGPMPFELSHPDVELPEGEGPLVLVASSTAHDAHQLVRVALEALAPEPLRVIATLNRAGHQWNGPVPANARVIDWLSYAQVMSEAAVVISNGGHGTVVRALTEGLPVLVCSAGADTAENGARVTWAGAGLMVPRRLATAATLRFAVRRLLGEPRFARRAGELAAWSRSNDGAARGAELVEHLVRIRQR